MVVAFAARSPGGKQTPLTLDVHHYYGYPF
uniref:Uncharacterized protein n=1 Tax=Anguilla anguilla TaxID=7936 RepID=A0A0E9XC47_ANGAN